MYGVYAFCTIVTISYGITEREARKSEFLLQELAGRSASHTATASPFNPLAGKGELRRQLSRVLSA